MNKNIIVLSACLLISGAVIASLFASENNNIQANNLEQVPVKVRDAIKRLMKESEVGEIETETEGDKTVYEVEIVREEIEIEFVFDENGSLLRFEIDEDEEETDRDDEQDGEQDDAQIVTINTIPDAPRTALQKLAGQSKLSEVKLEVEDGVKVYEAGWETGGVEHEASVTATGDVVETESVVAVNASPKAVQDRAVELFPKGTKLIIEKKTIFLYEIIAEVDGEEEEILVSPTGQQVEIEVGDQEDED